MSPTVLKYLMTAAGVALGAVAVGVPKLAPFSGALLWLAGILKGGALIQAPATTDQLVKRAADAVAKEEK